MNSKEHIECPYCSNNKIIKHGKTRSGDPRLRCKECGKTWVKGIEIYQKPDIGAVAEAFLIGYSTRELVPFYKSSPHRINTKIREFLTEADNWETFLDDNSEIRKQNVIYLQGIWFNCSYGNPKDNRMYLAMAIEGLSSNVIGFEIAENNDSEVWDTLLTRLHKRGYQTKTFVCKDIKTVEKSVNKYFPKSGLKLYLHKIKRDKEMANKCCLLEKKSLRDKLIDDAIKNYLKLDNQSYTSYLENKFDMDLKSCIMSNCENFAKCMEKNCGERSEARLEQLLEDFKDRFEKFHALKTNPYPVINCWLGLHMLKPLDSKFTRYSLYNQVPCKCSFQCFACKHNDERCEYIPSEEELNNFANEITIRALQLPVDKKTPTFKLKLDLA